MLSPGTVARMRTLRFCFDYISPYAYLAWTQLPALATRHGLELEPQPLLFAAMLDARKARGPAEDPARRPYIIRDLARIAHRFQVPFVLPPTHPFNPLLALRLTSLPMPVEQRLSLIALLFRATWATGEGITDPTVVARIAREAGLPSSALDDAQSADNKARVKAQTQRAMADGAFGVPTFFVDGQQFFGCDSLPHLEHYLLGGDVVSPALVEQWAKLPSSAARPGAAV